MVLLDVYKPLDDFFFYNGQEVSIMVYPVYNPDINPKNYAYYGGASPPNLANGVSDLELLKNTQTFSKFPAVILNPDILYSTFTSNDLLDVTSKRPVYEFVHGSRFRVSNIGVNQRINSSSFTLEVRFWIKSGFSVPLHLFRGGDSSPVYEVITINEQSQIVFCGHNTSIEYSGGYWLDLMFIFDQTTNNLKVYFKPNNNSTSALTYETASYALIYENSFSTNLPYSSYWYGHNNDTDIFNSNIHSFLKHLRLTKNIRPTSGRKFFEMYYIKSKNSAYINQMPIHRIYNSSQLIWQSPFL